MSGIKGYTAEEIADIRLDYNLLNTLTSGAITAVRE